MKWESKSTAFYGGRFHENVLNKVRVFEGKPKNFLMEFDECNSYKNHQLTQEEEILFLEYFSYMPETFQKCFKEDVFAIYFVEGMWYGALTDFIFDETGRMYCTIFFNIDLFNKTLTEWFEHRDNTIFKKTDEKNMLKVECSTEYKALLHTLIHETAHVYDYTRQMTPYCDSMEEEGKTESEYFSVWKDMQHPLKKYDSPLLSEFSFYYFGKQIPYSKGKKLIKYLSTTPFSSLYGAKNWMDDFAETVTLYYLKKAFGINYKVTYVSNGKEIGSYSYEENKNVQMWNFMCRIITGK